MEVIVKPDEKSAGEAAAELVINWCGQAIDERGRCCLALSGGTTPKPLYEIIARNFAKAIDWNKVFVFFTDERSVSPEHPESNFAMIKEKLLDPVGIPGLHVFRMKGEWKNRNNAAQQYEANIIRFASKNSHGKPVLDVCLLGVGEDGHTASLFPGSKGLLEDIKFITTNFIPEIKTSRLTMTLPLLNLSKKILFFVTGDRKAKIVKAIQEHPGHYPAGKVRGREETVWVLDVHAASGLTLAM